MSNIEKNVKKRYQEARYGLTCRLAKLEEMNKSDQFSSEQWHALRSMRPGVGSSTLIQMALLYYAQHLPDILIAEQEKELERLKTLKNTFFATE